MPTSGMWSSPELQRCRTLIVIALKEEFEAFSAGFRIPLYPRPVSNDRVVHASASHPGGGFINCLIFALSSLMRTGLLK